jgi:hypothetical protein
MSRLSFNLPAFLFALFLLQSAVCPVASETIQLTRENQRFSMPVLVNGAMRLHFVLDTGADGVTIPAEVLLTLLHSRTVDESDVQLGDAVAS